MCMLFLWPLKVSTKTKHHETEAINNRESNAQSLMMGNSMRHKEESFEDLAQSYIHPQKKRPFFIDNFNIEPVSQL